MQSTSENWVQGDCVLVEKDGVEIVGFDIFGSLAIHGDEFVAISHFSSAHRSAENAGSLETDGVVRIGLGNERSIRKHVPGCLFSTRTDPFVTLDAKGEMEAKTVKTDQSLWKSNIGSIKGIAAVMADADVVVVVKGQDGAGGVVTSFSMKDGEKLCEFTLDPVPGILGVDNLNKEMIALKSNMELVFLSPEEANSKNLKVALFNLKTGEKKMTFQIAVPEKLSYFTTTLRNRVVRNFPLCGGHDILCFACWDDFTPKLIDLETGTNVGPRLFERNDEDGQPNTSPVEATVKTIAVNNKYIACGMEWQRYLKKKVAKVFDIESGECKAVLNCSGSTALQFEFHPTIDNLLITALKHQDNLRVWDVETGDHLYTLALKSPTKHEIYAFDVSKDYLAVMSYPKQSHWNQTAVLHHFDFSGKAGTENSITISKGKPQVARKKRRGPLD